MPWPIASWRRMPEDPAASTTGISPAGAGVDSKRTTVFLTHSRTIRSMRSAE
jgi:hypothetical protein